MIEEGIVNLGGGGRNGEGRKAGGECFQGQLLDGPYGPRVAEASSDFQ